MQALLKETKLDIQGYYPVIVFVDGEYWGVYTFRNRYDAHYFQSYYGIDSENLIVIKDEHSLKIGNPSDEDLFNAMLREIDEGFFTDYSLVTKALADDEKYARIASMMDIDNFMDYMIIGVFTNKQDWPGKNILYWRVREAESEPRYGHDGKWRWGVFDLDLTFMDPSRKSLIDILEGNNRTSFLLRSLLQNEEFEAQFLNRFADLVNTLFREEAVLAKIDAVEAEFKPEMAEHIARWGEPGGSVEEWQENVELIREFARVRPKVQRKQLVEYFGLAGTAELEVRVNPGQGHVRVNSVEIREGATGVADPANWTGIYFQGVPIRVTAVPAEGYVFSHWEGLDDGDEREESMEIVLSGDLSIRAVFDRR